jgi:uncharacterized membrane protein YfcA
MPDLLSFVVSALGVFLIAFMRGAFGGGFAIIGIPLLSLVLDPIAAGAVLAPLFIAMDIFALRYWSPSTWSKPDVVRLVPASLVGIAAGFALMRSIDIHLTAIVIALVTLAFAGHWLIGGGIPQARPRSTAKALTWGTIGGVTTMVAHSGGPPLAMYLLPLGLPKAVYAGTTSIVFTAINLAKAGPWLLLGQPTRSLWTLMALCVPVVPIGIHVGWLLHERLSQRQMYRACYGLLTVTACKLLWDGLRGYL